jgi:hypothetical protein
MAPASAARAAAPAGGTFLALGFPVFRLLWATSLFVNLGT